MIVETLSIQPCCICARKEYTEHLSPSPVWLNMPSSAFYVGRWSQIFALILWRLLVHTYSVCTHHSACMKQHRLADRSPLRLCCDVVICGGCLPPVPQGLITTCFNPGSTIKSLICPGIAFSTHKRRCNVHRWIVSTQTRKAKLVYWIVRV